MARGGEIARPQIDQHVDACQAAQDALVAKIRCQSLRFIQLRRREGIFDAEQNRAGLTAENQGQPCRVVERAIDAFTFSQIAGGFGRVEDGGGVTMGTAISE